MEEQQPLQSLEDDHPPAPNSEGENLFQDLLAAANMALPTDTDNDHPPPSIQPPTQNDDMEEGPPLNNNVMDEGDEVQVPSESNNTDFNTTGESQDHYIFTKSPSSGSGGSDYEDDDDEESPEYQTPALESAMDVESSKGTVGSIGESAEQNTESQDGRSEDNSGGIEQEDDNGDQLMEHDRSQYGNEQQYDPFEESYAYEGYGYDRAERLEDATEADAAGQIKIFVSNLPPGLPSSELKELFEKYGEVNECEIFAKNYAFVHMTSPESGLEAISELNGLDIQGCKINVKRSVQTGGKSFDDLLPKNAVKGEALEVGTYKIFIAGLFEDVTKEYVKKLLEESECGNVVEVEIFRNNSAFVHMETEEGGKMAMEKLNGKVIPDPNPNPDQDPESEPEEITLRVTESKNPKGPTLPTMNLKVKHISPLVSAADLRSLFAPYGLVLGVQIYPKIYFDFGGTRHAAVLLEQYGNIRSAIRELSGKEVNGIKLSVEARFDDKRCTTSRDKQNRSFNQNEDSEWQEVGSSPVHTHPHPPRRPPRVPRPAPVPLLRLIPMPSQADMQRYPRGIRGRPGRPSLGHGPPSLFDQHFGRPRPLFSPFGNNGDNSGYDEAINDGFGGGYSHCNNEGEGYDDYGYNNESDRYIPPMKRFRDWNNLGGSHSFEQQHGNRPNARGGSRQNPFPHFPAPEEFPVVKKPPPLLSVQAQQAPVENCDWSDDLSLASLTASFSTGVPVVGQDFAGDETSTATTHAVPFDYSQVNKRKNMRAIPMPSQGDFRGRGRGQRTFSNQRGKNLKMGRGKKGTPRRPGLGTSQQQKKFSNQAGTDNVTQDAVNQLVVAEPSGATAGVSGGNVAASSPYAPYYFQQNWTFKSKHPIGKPSVKQMKEAEEEQKRQYADYLKQKPWLYQAIPGTVKRVDK